MSPEADSRKPNDHAVLLVSCPDRRGITAAVTTFIFQHNGNIIHADQHIDEQTNTFFMRVEWDMNGFIIPRADIPNVWRSLAEKFDMNWELSFTNRPARVAIFVSKHLHCLQDLLWRFKAGQLYCEIPLIISNHPDGRALAESFGIPYHEISIVTENKGTQEKWEIEILKRAQVDVIFLARYHQILTPPFVREFPFKIINIHHSFLPAFIGKNPYAQAFEKGVKIIGATSHFVTEELDQGPIIEQDTVRVSHRDSLAEMMQKGQDLERMVAYRALRLYLEKRVLCYGNKTVVFD